MKKCIVYLMSLLGVCTYGQTKKYSNEFLNIGVDAAAMGMANSVVAQTNDAYSTYWNPAGLTKLTKQQIGLMHASYFANIAQYDFAAFGMPVDEKSAIGVSLIRFGVDDILNTTQLIDSQGNIDYSRISKFSTADYAFVGSYARKLGVEGLSIGGNAKIIRRVIGKFADSWGFGFDFGLQYQSKDGLKFGAMLRDATTTYNTWNINSSEYDKIKDAVEGQNQTMPETTEITLPKLQVGASKDFYFKEKYRFSPAFVLHTEFYQTNAVISTKAFSIQPSFGFEAAYDQMVFLRAGMGNFQNELQFDNKKQLTFQPNIGIGFRYKGIQVDYALTDIGNQSAALYSNVFSLKLDLSVFKK